MIIQKIATFISDHALISANDHVIVALSGGRDSVFLLHILLEIQKSLAIKIGAVHINHDTRGVESLRDEKFVTDLCHEKKIDCRVYKLVGFSAESGESALRKARYAQFDLHLKKNGKAKIATAHHLDDQLETYLMRLFKGSGLKGLRGIPIRRGNFIRPLLGCSRKEIDQYCYEKKIKYIDDSSNAQQNRLRNKVRHQIIPVLNNVFDSDFLQQFEESQNKQTLFYNDAKKLYFTQFESFIKKRKDGLDLSCRQFASLSPIQQQLIIEYCFYTLNNVTFWFNKEQLEQFVIFNASAQTGSLFLLHDNLHILKDRSRLFFYVPEQHNHFTKELYKEQNVIVGDFSVSIESWSKEKIKFVSSQNVEFINGDKITFPLIIRTWHEGDFFYPLGKQGKQKVSDFYINEKIDRSSKNKIPIITHGNEIVWIGGKRLDDRYKVIASAKKVYKLEIKNYDRDQAN